MTSVQHAAPVVPGRLLVLVAHALARGSALLARAAAGVERAGRRAPAGRPDGPELGLPRHWAAGTTLGPLVGRAGADGRDVR